MAASSGNINQRIVATGLGEIQRAFAETGNSAEQSGNKIRAALVQAISPARQFNSATRDVGASAAATRYAIQNFSFQVNDVATSLASGISPFRTFTQQVGQFVQLFQQGGGVRAVLGGVAERLAALISPTTLAVAAVAGLAAGFALIVARAASAQSATRQFDVTLQGMHKNTQVTGAQLEKAAESFKDIGVSAAEGRKEILSFLQAGGDPRRAAQAVRVAHDVSAVLGTSVESFLDAAAKGGPALEEFGRRLGIVGGLSEAVKKHLEDATRSAEVFRQNIQHAFQAENKQLEDLARSEKRAQEDRDRAKRQEFRGLTSDQVAEEDRTVQHQRNLEDIYRNSAQQINDIITQRNQENAKQLEEYNKTILDEAQKALDNNGGLLEQIAQRVTGASNEALSPLHDTFRKLDAAWTDFLNTLSNSQVIADLIVKLTNFVRVLTALIEKISGAEAAAGSAATSVPPPPGVSGPDYLPSYLFPSGQIPGNALGGLIRGPGSGTSDSILSRVSNGEFIVNAMATRMHLPVLQAINSMRMPRVSSPRGFAMGGLVSTASSGGGTPVHIHIGGNSYQLTGERGIVSSLTQAARRSALLSAGRKPSTA